MSLVDLAGWPLSWRASIILCLVVWSGPYNDSLSCFIKLVTFVSGVVALIWLHVFTIVGLVGLNLAVQVRRHITTTDKSFQSESLRL